MLYVCLQNKSSNVTLHLSDCQQSPNSQQLGPKPAPAKLIAQLPYIVIWISVFIVQIQITEKYSTAICQHLRCLAVQVFQPASSYVELS